MSEGVQMEIGTSLTLPAEPRQVQALFKLVQRIPMSDAEACFIEDVFNRWFNAIREQQNQLAALQKLAALAQQQPDHNQPDQPPSAELDQLPTLAPADVVEPSPENPPEGASGPLDASAA